MHEVFTNKIVNNLDFQNFTLKKLLVGNFLNPKNDSNSSPIVFINLSTNDEHNDVITLKALLDTGATSSLIKSKFVTNLTKTPSEPTAWKTAVGYFETHEMVKTEFLIPELNDQRLISTEMHETQQDMPYDVIIGLDLLKELKIDILCSNLTVKWDDHEVSFKDRNISIKEAMQMNADPKHIQEASDRINKILDAKYEPANLEQVTKDTPGLDVEQRKQLFHVLKKFEPLFDGTLGKWIASPHKIFLKDPNIQPYHGKPFSIPQAYEAQLRVEVERLCRIGVLKKVNHSEWASPTFVIPKKDKTIRFISDFRELNRRIKRFPFPIPNIQDLLRKLGGFKWASALDLNMGYYHIELCPDSKKLCTIVLPWGKYEYQKLPMGLCNAPDIFQENMTNLFRELEYEREYIDDLLITTNGTYQNHLKKT